MVIKIWDSEKGKEQSAEGVHNKLAVMLTDLKTTEDGNMFMGHTEITSLADGADKDVLIMCDSSYEYHLRNYEVLVDGAPGYFYLYENPVVSDNGTEFTNYNMDRNKTNVTSLATYFDPTVTSVGEQIDHHYITADFKGGGHGENGPPVIILGNGKNYLLRFSNDSGGVISGEMHIRHYLQEID